MLDARFFARFGMLVVDRFVDEATCRRLRGEMRSAATTPASVGQDGKEVVDADVRAAAWASVSRDSKVEILARFRSLKPELERHFDVRLGECQPPQFLVYRPGDFYDAHSDVGRGGELPDYVTRRVLSVVLFLNPQADEDTADGYTGGALTFCGLIDDPRLDSFVYPLRGEEGLLVVFRSTLVHGVAPVARGERYTVVTWFC